MESRLPAGRHQGRGRRPWPGAMPASLRAARRVAERDRACATGVHWPCIQPCTSLRHPAGRRVALARSLLCSSWPLGPSSCRASARLGRQQALRWQAGLTSPGGAKAGFRPPASPMPPGQLCIGPILSLARREQRAPRKARISSESRLISSCKARTSVRTSRRISRSTSRSISRSSPSHEVGRDGRRDQGQHAIAQDDHKHREDLGRRRARHHVASAAHGGGRVKASHRPSPRVLTLGQPGKSPARTSRAPAAQGPSGRPRPRGKTGSARPRPCGQGQQRHPPGGRPGSSRTPANEAAKNAAATR